MQNTPKTRDIQCDFSEKSENSQILCTTNHKSNIIVGKNSENLDFPQTVNKFLQNICGSIRV